MIVTVSGRSGLTKAYTSVLSAKGSWLISGASRWLDAETPGVRIANGVPATATRKAVMKILRNMWNVPFCGRSRLCLTRDHLSERHPDVRAEEETEDTT